VGRSTRDIATPIVGCATDGVGCLWSGRSGSAQAGGMQPEGGPHGLSSRSVGGAATSCGHQSDVPHAVAQQLQSELLGQSWTAELRCMLVVAKRPYSR